MKWNRDRLNPREIIRSLLNFVRFDILEIENPCINVSQPPLPLAG